MVPLHLPAAHPESGAGRRPAAPLCFQQLGEPLPCPTGGQQVEQQSWSLGSGPGPRGTFTGWAPGGKVRSSSDAAGREGKFCAASPTRCGKTESSEGWGLPAPSGQRLESTVLLLLGRGQRQNPGAEQGQGNAFVLEESRENLWAAPEHRSAGGPLHPTELRTNSAVGMESPRPHLVLNPVFCPLTRDVCSPSAQPWRKELLAEGSPPSPKGCCWFLGVLGGRRRPPQPTAGGRSCSLCTALTLDLSRRFHAQQQLRPHLSIL